MPDASLGTRVLSPTFIPSYAFQQIAQVDPPCHDMSYRCLAGPRAPATAIDTQKARMLHNPRKIAFTSSMRRAGVGLLHGL